MWPQRGWRCCCRWARRWCWDRRAKRGLGGRRRKRPSWGSAVRGGSWPRRWLAVGAVALLATGSVGAWLGLGLGALYGGWWALRPATARDHRRVALAIDAALLLLAAAGLAAWFVVLGRGADLLASPGARPSLWHDALGADRRLSLHRRRARQHHDAALDLCLSAPRRLHFTRTQSLPGAGAGAGAAGANRLSFLDAHGGGGVGARRTAWRGAPSHTGSHRRRARRAAGARAGRRRALRQPAGAADLAARGAGVGGRRSRMAARWRRRGAGCCSP